jgi:hypothetical protein
MGLFDSMKRFLQGRELRREVADFEREVNQLSVDEAKAQFEALVSDPGKYKVVESPPSPAQQAMLATLPPSARDLFARYEALKERFGDTRLSRSEIGPSQYSPELVRVGRGVASTELAIRPGAETLYRFDGSESSVDQMEQFSSIYHYLLLMARLVYTD